MMLTPESLNYTETLNIARLLKRVTSDIITGL